MISDLRVLGVCPARGGSKGIPRKNLKIVGGESLVSRVGRLAAEVPEIDRVVVSTDDEEIAAVAARAGLAAPFRRTRALGADQVADHPVLEHALHEMERIDGVRYDIIVMLQPTSPLRRPEHVSECIKMLVEGGWDSVWTVSETDSKSHPLKQFTIVGDRLDYYDPAGKAIIARQQLRPVYHRNGIAYAITRQCLVEQGSIMGSQPGALVLEGNFVSIDTEWDCDLVELIMARDQNPVISA